MYVLIDTPTYVYIYNNTIYHESIQDTKHVTKYL